MLKYSDFIKEGFESKWNVFNHRLALLIIDEVEDAFDIKLSYFIDDVLVLKIPKVQIFQKILHFIIYLLKEYGITKYTIFDGEDELNFEVDSIPDDVLYSEKIFKK